MITYGIGVLPQIRYIREEHPCVTWTWYKDNVGEGVTFKHILAYFQDMQARVPPRGYFLEPTKSILGVAPKNVPR